MPHLPNPYIAGDPVGNTPAFVGRGDVLRAVTQMLRHPTQNALTLYGQRRIGKTSVLQHLLAHLPEAGPYRPIYFDLQDKAALPLGRVLTELARTLADKLALPAPDLGADPETGFRQTWLPEVLAALPPGTCLVLLFDEFDVLADPLAGQAAKAFFPYLRDLLALDRTRLRFIFVLGRNPYDLSSVALSLFKGTASQRVSLLPAAEAEALVRLSEPGGGLRWEVEAVQAVWALTHGHPFLTQALCSQVWELAFEENTSPTPVTAAEVEVAVGATLEASRNTLEWLWDGLGPAERIVAAALAQAGAAPVDEAQLEHLLREGGARLIIRELQDAPKLLQEWDLLEATDAGYVFRVELLRQWIAANRPLRRVQQELDRIQPRAESLYRVAQSYYEDEDLAEAETKLREALRANPNHLRANELLAELLITRNALAEARTLLEKFYDYAPANARQRLMQVYLAQAENAAENKDKLVLLEKVLALDPRHAEALAQIERIQAAMAEAERLALEQLIQSYLTQAQNAADNQVKLELLNKALTLDPAHAETQAQIESTRAAMAEAERLAREEQEQREQAAREAQERAKRLAQEDNELAHRFLIGQVALKHRSWAQAINALQWVVQTRPDYVAEKQFAVDLLAKALRRGGLAPETRQVLTSAGVLLVLSWVVLFILGGAGYGLAVQPQLNAAQTLQASSQLTATQVKTATTPIVTLIRPADTMTMVFVPAGMFIMGSDDGDSDEAPAHPVSLTTFYIDQTEVTNAQYARCVAADACAPPHQTSSSTHTTYYGEAEFAHYPVIYVDWVQANTYCQWVGARLPTEAEWEKAARGTAAYLYPWGHDFDGDRLNFFEGVRLNFCDTNCDFDWADKNVDDSYADTAPVGYYPAGASPYGALDMAGNVWEWTSSLYKNYPYKATDGREDLKDRISGRVLRGGAWDDLAIYARTIYRDRYSPINAVKDIGFRCAYSP